MDMTDFAKVRQYYRNFDEENRLTADGSGRLEFEMTLRILRKHLPECAKILDLGGAAGVYSFPLAEMGYEVYLADLSETLIAQARTKDAHGLLKGCDVVNAVDLGRYEDDFFDVVLLLGPLYHLTEQSEREACLREVNRVLKSDGMVFAAFIPHLAGSIAIVDRYLRRPEQVNAENLSEVFRSGRFRNASGSGFQEGYYPTAAEIRNLFSAHGFEEIEVRSVRGFGYEKEDGIYSIKDPEMLNSVMEWIERTASEDAIVEMCGHAVYIGTKKSRTA